MEKVSVPRCYYPLGFGTIVRREIHAFSDASEDATGAAVYLRQVDNRGENCTALVFGQSRVTPVQITSIPRLDLCAAVRAAQAVDKIIKKIDMGIDEFTFYTDLKPRPANSSKISSPEQWTYVDTNENPVDLTMRPLNAQNLAESD